MNKFIILQIESERYIAQILELLIGQCNRDCVKFTARHVLILPMRASTPLVPGRCYVNQVWIKPRLFAGLGELPLAGCGCSIQRATRHAGLIDVAESECWSALKFDPARSLQINKLEC